MPHVSFDLGGAKVAAKFFVVLALSFFLFQSVSPVYANPVDPPLINTTVSTIPISNNVFFEKRSLFFWPLSEMFYNNPEDVMVQTLILEAVGEGYEGMVAVGEVIRNRAKFFQKDFNSVCLMPKQFSGWNDAGRAACFLEEHRDHYFLALAAWRESENTALTNGATDYHADYVHPYWADAYQVTATIGKHIFYIRT